ARVFGIVVQSRAEVGVVGTVPEGLAAVESPGSLFFTELVRLLARAVELGEARIAFPRVGDVDAHRLLDEAVVHDPCLAGSEQRRGGRRAHPVGSFAAADSLASALGSGSVPCAEQ